MCPFQVLSLRIPQLVLICSVASLFPAGNVVRAAQQDQLVDVTTFHYDFMRTGWN